MKKSYLTLGLLAVTLPLSMTAAYAEDNFSSLDYESREAAAAALKEEEDKTLNTIENSFITSDEVIENKTLFKTTKDIISETITESHKVNGDKDTYLIPSDAWIIIKQGNINDGYAIWSLESQSEEVYNQIKKEAASLDGGGNDYTRHNAVIIYGLDSFDLSTVIANNWGTYQFSYDEHGNVIMKCDVQKISHAIIGGGVIKEKTVEEIEEERISYSWKYSWDVKVLPQEEPKEDPDPEEKEKIDEPDPTPEKEEESIPEEKPVIPAKRKLTGTKVKSVPETGDTAIYVPVAGALVSLLTLLKAKKKDLE